MRIVVIGGGIIGLLTARELALAGMAVSVVDQGRIGAEASWAGGGILSPLYPWRYAEPVNQLASWSQIHYPGLATALIQEGGIDPEWTRSGVLVLDPEEHALAMSWAKAHDLPCEEIDAPACNTLEPALQVPNASALWFPELAQIRNPRLVKSLAESCERNGIQLLESTPVNGIILRGQQVTAVKTATAHLTADAVVVASGAWSARLLAGLGLRLPIRPVRGQMIMYHGEPGQIRHINLYEGHYLIPRRDGRILVGSTLEEVDFDKSTTDAARQSLVEFATNLFPFLTPLAIEQQWAGLRPGSPHGIPYICSVSGMGGLFLNTGHYRNGVVLGYASARLMADLILEREPILPIEPYALSRGQT